jgi:hypothetical protein
MKRVTELVEYYLRKFPETRNDDKLLTYKVFQKLCQEQGEYFYVPFRLWKELPAFASIQKARQKIQNKEGRFKPNEETKQLRQKNQEDYREWYIEQ